MSIYAYLTCDDCRQLFWLGKAVKANDLVSYFHIGGPDEPPNWKREELNQIIWKFLADHAGHKIQVHLENQMSDDTFSYMDIDGDGENDLTANSYIGDWPGLR